MQEALVKRELVVQALARAESTAPETRPLLPAHLTIHSVSVDAAEPRNRVADFRPAGMGPGRYRAVSEPSETFVFTLDSTAKASDRDFYIADSPDGVRWYFIRVRDAG